VSEYLRGCLHPKQPSLPTLTEFMQEAERLRDTALSLLRQDGCHEPTVIAWTRDGRCEVIGLSLKDCPLNMGDVLKGLVRLRRIYAFVAIGEAWMTRGEGVRLDVPPSQSPEREQVLMVSAVHPQGKQGWFVPFRTEGGRTILGRPVSSAGLTLAGGIPEALNGEEGLR